MGISFIYFPCLIQLAGIFSKMLIRSGGVDIFLCQRQKSVLKFWPTPKLHMLSTRFYQVRQRTTMGGRAITKKL